MSHSRDIVEVANKLFEYSNFFVEIRCDPNMPMPGFSLIEEDIHGLFKPITVINPRVLPDNPSIIAHVMSHEWGHHVLRHIKKAPSIHDIEPIHIVKEKEDEADAYAARFVKSNNYDIDSIIAFMREHPIDLENRIQILRETPCDVEARSNSHNSSIHF